MNEPLTSEGHAECSHWIACNDRLPAWNKLVVAYVQGTKDHSDARWVRNGFAFMVRHNSRENVVGTDQWALWHHNEALERIDADELTVTHWMPLERPS